MISFQAPGKAVVWGEYAVLDGAPALVMAVNRYASARVAPAADEWHIRSVGFPDEQAVSAEELSQAKGAARVVHAALAGLEVHDIPPGARIETDTAGFYHGDGKLGIGSSAAICTALCAALAEYVGQPFSESAALVAHRLLQGSSGSGLDVAAACHGGLIRFQDGRSEPFEWPEGLHFGYLWTGHSAETPAHLGRFGDWRRSGPTTALTALGEACEALFRDPGIAALRDYVERLAALDRDADLGIFGPAHRRLAELANQAQVVYKPCGAGGGDIGIAVSDDPAAVHTFMTLAAEQSFLRLDLEIADHGVHRIRE
jgi:phosphomevalonate kinase